VFEDSEAGCLSALEAGCWVWQLVDVLSKTDAIKHSRLTRITSLGEGEQQLRSSLNTNG
jgi:beta-phosphoglucomutase-like phosphatase (HAD superfamily)